MKTRILIPVLCAILFVPLGIEAAYADLFCDFLSIFGLCQSNASQVTNKIVLSNEGIKPNEQAQLKQFDTSNIENGSHVESVAVNVSVNYNPSAQCELFLIDSTLKNMPISEPFTCASNSRVALNEIGKDALEYKTLSGDKLRFIVRSGVFVINSNVSIDEVIYTPPQYFAKIENGIVTNIIVADQAFIDSQPDMWIETTLDGSMRGNYAAQGYTYDSLNDVFIPPKTYDSWKLNTTTWTYDPPVPMPTDGLYNWNEKLLQWEPVS